jgi:hypothetical protein
MPSALDRQVFLEQGRCAMCGRWPVRPGRTNCVACAQMLHRRYVRRKSQLHLVPHIMPPAQPLCCGWWTCSWTVLPWECLTCRRLVRRQEVSP